MAVTEVQTMKFVKCCYGLILSDEVILLPLAGMKRALKPVFLVSCPRKLSKSYRVIHHPVSFQ